MTCNLTSYGFSTTTETLRFLETRKQQFIQGSTAVSQINGKEHFAQLGSSGILVAPSKLTPVEESEHLHGKTNLVFHLEKKLIELNPNVFVYDIYTQQSPLEIEHVKEAMRNAVANYQKSHPVEGTSSGRGVPGFFALLSSVTHTPVGLQYATDFLSLINLDESTEIVDLIRKIKTFLEESSRNYNADSLSQFILDGLADLGIITPHMRETYDKQACSDELGAWIAKTTIPAATEVAPLANSF